MNPKRLLSAITAQAIMLIPHYRARECRVDATSGVVTHRNDHPAARRDPGPRLCGIFLYHGKS